MGVFNHKEWRIFFTFWIIFSSFSMFINWNENSRIDLTLAIIDEGTLSIDSFYKNTGDRAYFEKHYYSDKTPGMSFLTMPIYVVYKFFFGTPVLHHNLFNIGVSLSWLWLVFLFITFTSSLFGALSVILVYKSLKFFTKKELHKNVIVIVYGLGTLVFVYSRLFLSHVTGTFFIFLSFYLILQMKHESGWTKKKCFLAGLVGGLAVVVEYPVVMVLFCLIVFMFFLKKWKQTIIFIAGSILSLMLLFFYSHSITGSPFVSLYSFVDDNLLENYQIDDSGTNSDYSSENLSNFIFSAKLATKTMFFFHKEKLSKILRLLFLPYRGLFFYYPILLFSLFGLFFMFKKFKYESLFIVFIFLLFILFNSSLDTWWGGASFGPRHLTLLMPFLMIPLLFAMKKIKLKYLMPFIVISIFVNLLSLSEFEDVSFKNPDFASSLSYFEPVDNPLLSFYLPAFFTNHHRLFLLEKIFGFSSSSFNYSLLIIIILYFVWRKDIKIGGFRKK
ncbi:MAG: hypothetical protein KKC26_01095 [Nanoarchaeota archaeon]|nr:hypothetical protein [Nanoarchaeota archaeon]